jgi:hypothetical protein
MSGSAPAPPGMKRIPFPLESYEHISPPMSAKRLVNLYAEQAPADARSEVSLVSSYGLQLWQTVGSGPIHAVGGEQPGPMYVVSGTRAYRVRYDAGIVVDDLGDVGEASGGGLIPDYAIMVTIACGITACVICVPPRAYTCGHRPGDPLNQIGGTYPGATTVAYHDGYFVYTAYDNYDTFFISKLLDPLSYDALDFASSDALPNVLRLTVSHRGQLWMMGEAGLEVWYDAGQVDFPYRRVPGAIVPHGSATPKSVAQCDGSIFWVGPDDIVYRSVGYQAQRVSTHAIEHIIYTTANALGNFGAYNIVSAHSFSQNGHTFYALNLATRTLVYDCATKLWHERSSSVDGSDRWRPEYSYRVSDSVIFADSLSGQLLIAQESGDELGGLVARSLITPPLWAGTRRAFCSRLEVEMEVGTSHSPGDVVLDWSDDGGITWTGGPRTMNSGTSGQTRKRVVATRLGSFRQRVFRVTVHGRAMFYAIDADVVGGAS